MDDPAEVAAVNAQADDWVPKALALKALSQQKLFSADQTDDSVARALAARLQQPNYARPIPPPPPPPPKDFGNQPASASAGPHRLPGQSPESEKYWQVTGDGGATAWLWSASC